MTGDYVRPQSASDASTVWTEVAIPPQLSADVVHIWRHPLTLTDAHSTAFLSRDEIERAARFSSDITRNRFMIRRTFLRRLLSLYTQEPPGILRFTYGHRGKPDLSNISTRVAFNQSDSGNWTVIAITSAPDVGVDIEELDAGVDIGVLADEVFSTKERSELAAVSDQNRRLAFFNGWTRKEALIKADGSGLAFPLRDIEVSLDPALPVSIHRFGENLPEDWSLLSFGVAPGILGAVAVRHPKASLARFQLSSCNT